jgi:HAD superfamily hydrolase (TIGR01549 family)
LAYDGINEVLSVTRDNGIKLAIVSSSPSSYVQRVVRQLGWSFDFTICYHDTTQHKPHPAPFIEAVNRLKIAARDCWAIGDDPKDIIAARAAYLASCLRHSTKICPIEQTSDTLDTLGNSA